MFRVWMCLSFYCRVLYFWSKVSFLSTNLQNYFFIYQNCDNLLKELPIYVTIAWLLLCFSPMLSISFFRHIKLQTISSDSWCSRKKNLVRNIQKPQIHAFVFLSEYMFNSCHLRIMFTGLVFILYICTPPFLMLLFWCKLWV